MKRAWLFNPDNDIALAKNVANFTPPPAGLDMQQAGELLPMFLAEKDDSVICGGVNAAWFEDFKDKFHLEADIWNHNPESFTPTPWGWSEAAKRRFEHLGFNDELMPSHGQLAAYRELSHRRTASRISKCLSSHTHLNIWPAAIEADSEFALAQALRATGPAMVKAPWSSSGRGVRYYKGSDLEKFALQSAGTIRSQGCVMVEKFMENHFDFALLYQCENGSAKYVGPSLCMSDSLEGRYLGNVVASPEVLSVEIQKHFDEKALFVLTNSLQCAVSEVIAPQYEGPVGIDLCINTAGEIHVCEANLRYTMGFVARGIAKHIPGKWILECCPANKIPEQATLLTPPGTNRVFILIDA